MDFVQASHQRKEPGGESLNRLTLFDSLTGGNEMESMQPMLNSDQHGSINTRNWSAEDVSKIYVRYRPHLESHVWRILGNRSQTEDVVQETFLYLLTTLPNLDSEVGVLRYLKWKSRMLALDLINLKSSNQASLEQIDTANLMDTSLTPEMSVELAEEAAIVQLALAKLQPRQRELLVATVLEERSTDEVASRMGLSKNALRQLNFRARQSFRRSLESEVEARGLSLNEFLGSSIRKILEGSKSGIARGGAAILLVVVSVLGGFQLVQHDGLNASNNTIILSQSQKESALEPTTSENGNFDDLDIRGQLNPLAEDALAPENLGPAIESANPSRGKLEVPIEESLPDLVGQSPESQEGKGALEASGQRESDANNLAVFTSVFNNDLASRLGRESISDWSSRAETNSLQLQNSSGFQVEFVYDLEADNPIQFTWISFAVDEVPYIAVPKVSFSKVRALETGYVLDYVATDLVIGDVVGELGNVASNDTDLSKAAVFAQIYFDPDHRVYKSNLRLEPRL